MMNTTLIAIALGLVSAIAFLSATTGPLPVKALFSLIAPLPIMLAGLGWGPQAGLIAGTAGAAILLGLNPSAGLLFMTTVGFPAAVLAYLASLSRPVEAGDGTNEAAREWYPVGRLVLWAAVLAALPSILWSSIADMSRPEQKEALLKMLNDAMTAAELKQGSTGLPLPPEQIATLTNYVYSALPALAALAWMGGLLLTLWLAARIMRSSGQLARPWPDFGKLDYPAIASLAFVAALAFSTFDGIAGIAGRALTGTLLLAFMLLGLAVIHDLTRGWHWRAFVLGMIYGSLFLISLVVAFPLALIGLTEGLFQFRSRFSPPPAGDT